MRKSTTTMAMPATVILVDKSAKEEDIDEVFSYFQHIDDILSTYKETSEISKINNGMLSIEDASEEVEEVLILCEKAQRHTDGYFDIYRDGKIDPSGMVKGYAIRQAAEMLRKKGYKNFYVEIAGDIEVAGSNEEGSPWRIGIENPFKKEEIVKVVTLVNKGIATSGNYKQGQHIYNPVTKTQANEIMSMTVIAENVQEADMLATATFAMGEKGIDFLEKLPGIEGYMITKDLSAGRQAKQATYTSGFNKYVLT